MRIFNLFKSSNNSEKIITDYMQRDAIVIDVRTQLEFAEGHVKSSVNIPLNVILQKIDKIKKYNKPIIVVCKSGARSNSATSILKQHGIDVVNGGSWNTVEQIIV